MVQHTSSGFLVTVLGLSLQAQVRLSGHDARAYVVHIPLSVAPGGAQRGEGES